MPAPAAAGLHNCAVGAPGRVALLREAAGSAEAGGLGPSAGSGGSGGAGLHIVEVRGSPLGAAWDPHGDVLAASWKGRVAVYGWGAAGEDGALLAESSLRFIPQALALAAMPLPGGGRSYLLALGGVLGVAFRVLERGAPERSWTLLAAEAREAPPPPPQDGPARPLVVCALALGAGAETMATASVEGGIYIWDLRVGGEHPVGLERRLLFEGRVPSEGVKVTSVQFSPDDLSLAVLSWSGAVSLFRRRGDVWGPGLSLPAADSAVLPHWLPPLLCWVSRDIVAMAKGGGGAQGVFYFRVCEGWLEPLAAAGEPARRLHGSLRGLALSLPGQRSPGDPPRIVTFDAAGTIATEVPVSAR